MAATSPKSSVSAKTPKASAPARPSAEIRRVADLLKQVSDPTRLQVLMLLNEKERTSPSSAPTSGRRASRRSATTWPCSAMAA